jgi:hypothetical protein
MCSFRHYIPAAMQIGIVVGIFGMFGGFTAARAFQFWRLRHADDTRLSQKEVARRRHHFRGSLEMELDSKPAPGPSEPKRSQSHLSKAGLWIPRISVISHRRTRSVESKDPFPPQIARSTGASPGRTGSLNSLATT